MGLLDGPQTPCLEWGWPKSDDVEMYGGDFDTRCRWLWRSRWLVYVTARIAYERSL